MSGPPIDALKALAHPLRYRILAALAQGECNVGEIEAASKIGQPALSQQLAVLRDAGLVNHRREARQVFYSLDGQALGEVAQAIAALMPPSAAEPPVKRSATSTLHGASQFARLD